MSLICLVENRLRLIAPEVQQLSDPGNITALITEGLPRFNAGLIRLVQEYKGGDLTITGELEWHGEDWQDHGILKVEQSDAFISVVVSNFVMHSISFEGIHDWYTAHAPDGVFVLRSSGAVSVARCEVLTSISRVSFRAPAQAGAQGQEASA
jgi:hypothetical protein